eukprot:966851_1
MADEKESKEPIVNVEEPDLGDFLVGKGLSKYKDAVIDAGLDDIKDIKDLDDETVEVIIQEAGFKKIHGNIFRKAVKAYKDGKYKPKVADPLAKLTKLVREKRKHLKGYVARQIDNINAKDSKTIIFIGQTGVGKTTVINSICNYLEQVSYEEPFRYKLICEENNKKVDTNDKTKSQTQDITTYHLENIPAIKEAVNIVDTPGFGDTEGPQKDIKIRNQFKRFFEERCPFIDGIYFIIKASDTRVGAIQRYIFNMVLDLFGDDVRENIFVLFTFSDGQTPPALKAVNKLGIEYAQEFRINNSGFGLPDDDENKNNVFHQTFFDVGNQQFGTIFEALSAVRTKSTEKTKETLKERQNITASLEEISINLKAKLDEIKREKKQCEIIAAAQKDINSNADFQISSERAIIYKDYGSKAMLCNSCKEYPGHQTFLGKTCHSNCVSGSVFWCKQMTWFSGCKICGCAKAKHEQVNYRVRKRYEKIYINKKEMANKYDLAKGEKVTAENLMKAVKRKIKKCEEDTAATIQRMKKSVDRLQQIALNKTVMSNEKYFDSLIAAETQTKEEGWVERVNELIKMKNNFKRLDAVVKGDVDAKTLQEQWMNDEKENEKVNVNVQVSGSNVNVQVNVS